MADYPILAATLAAMAATENDPAGSEDAAKIDDCLRQTRNWLGDFLTVAHNNDGSLKASALTAITSGLIRGTNPVGLVQREILQASILSQDLADNAVTTAKINDLAVTTGKINDLAVTAAKIANATITGAKLVAGTITSTQLGAGAVANSNLAANAVAAANIQDATITGAKVVQNGINGDRLPSAAEGFLLVGGNTVNAVANSLAPKQITGAISIDSDGVSVINLGSANTAYAVIQETAASGSNGGNPGGGAGAYSTRGTSGFNSWNVVSDPAGFSGQNAGNVLLKKDGIYLVHVSAPGYDCGKHRIKVTAYPDAADVDVTNTYYGTSEKNDKTEPTTTRSHLSFLMAVENTTDVLHAKFIVQHWFEALATTAAQTGGFPATSGDTEVFAEVTILRLL